jgi:small conductance mechanosensitive channel
MTAILNFLKQAFVQRTIWVVFLVAVSLLVTKIILKIYDKFSKRSRLDPLVGKILRIALKILLLFLSVIIVLASLGISVSAFVATLSVVGVAFSLAVQGFLSNAVGGILLISTKPFKTGDYIEVGGDAGLVHEVGLFYTKLNTFDKKLIQIPNGKIANDTIVNYTSSDVRRVEVEVCLSYENEVQKVLSVLAKTFEEHPLVLSEEGLQPYAHVKEYQYSHICYTARAWCKTDDYWTVYFDTMDNLQASFAKNGVSFSYPHMNVHMVENKAVGNTTDTAPIFRK